VATRPGFGRLDQAVDAFQDAVVDFGCEPAQNPIPMAFYCISRFFGGLYAAVRCPEVPFLHKGLGGLHGLLVQFLEIESDMIGTTDFEVALF